MSLSRRDLIRTTALGTGALAVGRFSGLLSAQPALAKEVGELVSDPAGLLDLPPDFTYKIVSTKGTPLPGGGIVPGRVDGMASFSLPNDGLRIVQNHEIGANDAFPTLAATEFTYDPKAKGGTSTITLDRHLDPTDHYVSLAGTWSNCAGGLTPWGSWLTCEESEQRRGANADKDHGWVFEVDANNTANNVNPTPLTAMGRFAHEAAVVDPQRGDVYLTEDAGNPNGLVFKFEPNDRSGVYGSLRNGGRLFAMKCSRNGTHVPDLAMFSTPGTKLHVDWVPVPDPLATTTSIRRQFSNAQITRARKFEGAWWGDEQGARRGRSEKPSKHATNGRAHIVTSFARLSDGSLGEHDGQIWSYDPETQILELQLFLPVSPNYDSDIPDGPDNIAVSPYGGFFLAEDGDGVSHLLAVDLDGTTRPFARNARNEGEFVGVHFSPDGRALFAGLQADGLTFAIEGPFSRLP